MPLDPYATPIDRARQVGQNAYQRAANAENRKDFADDLAIRNAQAEEARRAAEEARRVAEAQNKTNMAIATSDALQWAQTPGYEAGYAKAPQEMRSHFLDAYGPEVAAQAPQIVDRATTQVTGRIPGLDPDLEESGAQVDEKGNSTRSFARPLKAASTGELTESDVAKEGIDPSAIPKKDWPAAVAKARAGREGKLTEMQSNAIQYSARMASNRKVLEQLESGGFDPSTTRAAAAGIDLFPNALRKEDEQSYLSARDNWISALLRKESGAAISKSEYENAYKQYFPQWGDAPSVIAQKTALRHTAENNMRLVAGGKAVDAETGGAITPPASAVPAAPATGTTPKPAQVRQNGIIYHLQPDGSYK